MERSVSSNRVAEGSVGGAALLTVTVMGDEVAVLPAASRARAVKVCAPSTAVRVSQATPYVAVVSSAPSGAPSRKNCTPATPTLSDAVAATPIVPNTVVPPAGEVMAADGGVVSAV